MGWFEGIPDTIRVGPYDVTVSIQDGVADSSGDEVFGTYSPSELILRLWTNQPSGAHAVCVVIHELGHAIYAIYECKPEDGEERLVATMAAAWTQIYRDNPEITRWIIETVNTKKTE